jgi:hypothetical protein
MKHTAHHIARWSAAAAAVAFLAGPAALPAAAREIPDEPMGSIPTVERIEVPVDDSGTEITQMGLAAALGAALAGGTAFALRRRSQRGTHLTPRTPQRAGAK